MKFSWVIHGGGREESDTETEDASPSPPENLVPPKGVSEPFCACVDSLKWKLYESVVMRPELNTPEAQQNELLQTYEGLLEKLYALLTQSLKGPIQESAIHGFPEELHSPIRTCVQNIQGMRRGGGALTRYTDRVPYHDYLQTQLRTYPYLQYHGEARKEED